MNNVPWQQRQPEEDGILPLRAPQEDISSSSAVASPSQNTLPRGSGDTGHYLSTGPSFSSLATNGSTIFTQMPTPAPMPASKSASSASPANAKSNTATTGQTTSTTNSATAGQTTFTTTTSAVNEHDLPPYQAGVGKEYMYTAPLGPPEEQQLQQQESYQGVLRQIPRTSSYYRRAGMTSRLDDLHHLANAPSFSSLSTSATSIASRMSLMGRNSHFEHLQPSFSGANANRLSTENGHFRAPATTSSTCNSSIGRPATENIFLRQDDPDYQNLLMSIATSTTVVVGRQPTTNNRCGPCPTSTGSRLQQQHQQQQVFTSSRSSSCGMLGLRRPSSSSALGLSSSSSTPRAASSSALRRSRNISAGSILRRGRYSSGFLTSIQEHEGAHPADGGGGSNRHNASFNGNGRRSSTSSRNHVQFTAPTIHQLVRDFQPNEMHGIPTNIVVDASTPNSKARTSLDSDAMSASPSVSGTSTPLSASKPPAVETKVECIDGSMIAKSNASSVCSAGRALRRGSGSLSSLSSLGSKRSNRV